jgi:hypothetical protein
VPANCVDVTATAPIVAISCDAIPADASSATGEKFPSPRVSDSDRHSARCVPKRSAMSYFANRAQEFVTPIGRASRLRRSRVYWLHANSPARRRVGQTVHFGHSFPTSSVSVPARIRTPASRRGLAWEAAHRRHVSNHRPRPKRFANLARASGLQPVPQLRLP